MMPPAILSYANAYSDPQPWKKAYSYSVFGHAALLLLLMLLAIKTRHMPLTILTEVEFIAKAAPVSLVPTPKAVAPLMKEAKQTATAAKTGESQKSKNEIYTSGQGPVRVEVTRPLPAGPAPKVPVGGSVPLAGPIVAHEPMGWIGRKSGALIELPTRTGGTLGKGVKDEKQSAGSLGEPVALSRLGVDQIRQREAVIGAPLISQSVVNGSLNGKTKELVGLTTPAEKHRVAEENLKANPLDKDKWGKQKGPFSMEGPLKYRKILKMELPPYPRWAEEKALEAAVSIRLWVNPKGKVVDNMYLERTSGYAELDHLAMDALSKFVFVPIPENLAQEDEWGVATFRFELKK